MSIAASSAALYLRSSKDRSDVSTAAQRRALEELARSRSLSIARIFEDAVESGSTEDRPAFMDLVRELKNARRGWSTLLVYDTSRLARRRYIAQAFKHEARKSGVAIMYATRPADVDPISEALLDGVFEAMDEVHSLMSRKKGLAGMAENVRQGWRAGGRAPMGYVLKAFTTGAVREGRPVTKSKLEPGELAATMRTYLRARAAGVPRTAAARQAHLDAASHTLIGVEWNALTYAGHTVWNVNREAGAGTKRRPRSDWHVHRDTHHSLITEREAESILAQLETSDMGAAVRAARATQSTFLLSGLLYSTDGRAWVGHGSDYRLRRREGLPGRVVGAARVDAAVVQTVQDLLTSDGYLEQLLVAAQKSTAAAAPGADIHVQIGKLERERSRAAERALAAADGDVYADLVEQRTRQIAALRREVEALQRETAVGADLQKMSVSSVRALIRDGDPVKAVRRFVDRVMLEPSLTCQLQLRRPDRQRGWLTMASPGRADSWPSELVVPVRLIA